MCVCVCVCLCADIFTDADKQLTLKLIFFSSSKSSFQSCINRGGLRFGTAWACKIVEETELIMKAGCWNRAQMSTALSRKMLENLVRHPLVTSFDEDLHETQLIKKISITYFDIKMLAKAKENNILRQKGTSLRQKLHRMILMNNV